MGVVFLGIGSNIDPARNLRLAVIELRRRFGEIKPSAVYRNAPVGFDGADFLNMVVRLESPLRPGDLLRELEEIHDLSGRVRDGDRHASRELDLDLLLYDRLVREDGGIELPRADVLRYDFVLRPLAEMAPEYVHPLTGRRLADHWQEMASADRRMVLEPFRFD